MQEKSSIIFVPVPAIQNRDQNEWEGVCCGEWNGELF